jgi:CHAT domain-containing protein/Flp pilus assembly protein TadD
VHGDLRESQEESERGYQRFRTSDVESAWKFKTLEAETLLWRGDYPEVLKQLAAPLPPTAPPDALIQVLTLKAIAHARQFDGDQAEKEFTEAERLCAITPHPSCGKLFQGRGLVAPARQFLRRSLSFARANGDKFLEATSLLNLGAASLKEEHFDEAIDWSHDAYDVATALTARDIALVAVLNIGWAYYRLGDSERALEMSLEAENRADELGDSFNRENAITNAGYVFMDRRDFSRAEKSFRQALDLAEAEHSKEHSFNALRVLALASVRSGNVEDARKYADQAISIARSGDNHLDELYPLLVKGLAAAQSRDDAEAERIFHEVGQDKLCPVFLQWEVEHSLARLYEDEGRADAADREYRAALATFEAARSPLRRNDSKLPFSNNASRIYDDYVHFLVAHGKADDALRWADYSRARTLSEGLGLLAKGASSGPPPLNPQQVARRADGTVLFYWLGEKQSYLWAISPKKTNLFTLPPGAEVDAAVQRYRKALVGPQDVLESADQDGRWLYRTLIAPAQALLNNDAKVFVIPDGSLNNLNFETLLVSEPKPSETKPSEAGLHYWIEDATIANASSLRVLGATRADRDLDREKRNRSLLLVGNSVAPNDKYPELPKAAAQMESVARHFPAATQRILAREQATPTAYLASSPEQFSTIHFVAHGTASRLSPLDSAIVLSRIALSKIALSKATPSPTGPFEAGVESDSFKLYARDIIRHPLRADLVTISACYGAGERAYSGEGLVGLSWAFLRAGAHNVVAALWEATDASTEQLMDKFYDELDKGAGPDAALRTAKLSLLRGGAFHNPFYWAPFQIYSGS